MVRPLSKPSSSGRTLRPSKGCRPPPRSRAAYAAAYDVKETGITALRPASSCWISWMRQIGAVETVQV